MSALDTQIDRQYDELATEADYVASQLRRLAAEATSLAEGFDGVRENSRNAYVPYMHESALSESVDRSFAKFRRVEAGLVALSRAQRAVEREARS